MRQYQRLVSAFVLIIFIPVAAFSQTLSGISGKVLSADGEPTAFATVMLLSSSDSTLVKANSSDADGNFELVGAPTGSYFVEVTYVGFETYQSYAFDYTAGTDKTVANVILQTSSEQLDEVVVKSTRPLVEVHPDKTVFNVEGSVNATGNNALELLRKSPGVVVDNSENLILAGKSGVKVYIDDKPSPLSGEDLANYLKTVQSSEIDNIEIITNPSARYDAEGNAGIINIRMRKDKSLGTNGSVNLGYRYGKSGKYDASTNFNHRNKTLNMFGSYGFFDGEFENHFQLYREQRDTSYDQQNEMFHGNQSHNFRLGTDFFLDDKSTIGFLFTGNINDNSGQGRSLTDITPLNTGELYQILDAISDRDGDRNNLNFNLNYVRRGDNDQTLNIDLDHGRFRNDGTSYQPNRYFDPTHSVVQSEKIFTTHTPTDIDIWTAKFDKETNWLKGKFAFGAKISLVETDNTYEFFDLIDGDKVLNMDRSNNFIFEENINAGYVSYQRQLNEKWNLMLGLRMENTHSTGTLSSESDNQITERDYTDWFPSGGLTYQLNQKNSFRLNYSRRIDRPSYQDLNPFEFKLDELAFQKGNAFLKPQYSDAISFTHTYNYRLNTSISYTVTNDVFTRITKALPDTSINASILTFENLAKQTNLALTVSYPFEVAKWWNVYTNLTAYHLHNEANIDGDMIDLDADALSFYAQNSFLLPKDFKLELSGWYNSPSLWEGNWETNSMYSVDIGVQKKFLNDRGTIKVSYSDIFGSQRWSGESTFGALYIRGGGRWESQQIRLNLSYLFGNTQVKSARRRNTGLDEEQKRIKTDN